MCGGKLTEHQLKNHGCLGGDSLWPLCLVPPPLAFVWVGSSGRQKASSSTEVPQKTQTAGFPLALRAPHMSHLPCRLGKNMGRDNLHYWPEERW